MFIQRWSKIAQYSISKWLDAKPIIQVSIIPYILLPMILFYLIVCAITILCLPHITNIHNTLILSFILIIFALLCFLFIHFKPHILQYKKHHRLLIVALPAFYLFVMYTLGFAVGLLNIAVGIVYGSVSILLFSIFDRKTVLWFIAIAIGLFLLIGLIPTTDIRYYAPVILPHAYQPGYMGLDYIFAIALFSLPQIIVFAVVSIQIFKMWYLKEAEIQYLSTTDGFLEVNNRRAITQELQAVLDRRDGETIGSSVSVILCDIDHFKLINDQFGHHMGDRVLRAVSDCLKSTIRQGDQVGRYGGEEFLISLKAADLRIALSVAERCREEINNLKIWNAEMKTFIPVTASFGVYSSNDPHQKIESVIEFADKWLYMAKNSGRNKVLGGEIP